MRLFATLLSEIDKNDDPETSNFLEFNLEFILQIAPSEQQNLEEHLNDFQIPYQMNTNL